ncbi:hypothetical protein J6590_026251 [Homalodisca vitripennis]|nr:hypothetical protein J6590_026251 [Homalodisca vitripennis]
MEKVLKPEISPLTWALIELGTFCVLGRRDNRYTTETALQEEKVRQYNKPFTSLHSIIGRVGHRFFVVQLRRDLKDILQS